jgi:hypothetical protein
MSRQQQRLGERLSGERVKREGFRGLLDLSRGGRVWRRQERQAIRAAGPGLLRLAWPRGRWCTGVHGTGLLQQLRWQRPS